MPPTAWRTATHPSTSAGAHRIGRGRRVQLVPLPALLAPVHSPFRVVLRPWAEPGRRVYTGILLAVRAEPRVAPAARRPCRRCRRGRRRRCRSPTGRRSGIVRGSRDHSGAQRPNGSSPEEQRLEVGQDLLGHRPPGRGRLRKLCPSMPSSVVMVTSAHGQAAVPGKRRACPSGRSGGTILTSVMRMGSPYARCCPDGYCGRTGDDRDGARPDREAHSPGADAFIASTSSSSTSRSLRVSTRTSTISLRPPGGEAAAPSRRPPASTYRRSDGPGDRGPPAARAGAWPGQGDVLVELFVRDIRDGL